MPVTRKPADQPAQNEPLPEDPEFQRYLRKGGSAGQSEPEMKDVKQTLTIPGALCQELDQLREKLLPLKKSRHQWVLEAIMEKVKRDKRADVE